MTSRRTECAEFPKQATLRLDSSNELVTSLSEELSEKLKRIENKIDSVKGIVQYLASSTDEISRRLNVTVGENIDVQLLKLPDSLRQSMFVMDKLREASAYQVAELTGRTRSAESFHLNQLERMGHLLKFRGGKKIYFKIPGRQTNHLAPDKQKKTHSS